MTKLEYFIYSLKNESPLVLNWVLLSFSKHVKDNEYYKIINKTIHANVESEWVPISDADVNKPILWWEDEIVLPKDTFRIVTEDIETTYGIALQNYIVLDFPFNGKLKYVNDVIDLGDVENEIASRLATGDNPITIDELQVFVQAVTAVQNYSPVAVVSSTDKSLMTSKDIVSFKTKAIKDMKEEFGEDVFEDYTKIAELEKKLKAFDLEYLEDDPALGIVLSGKILNIARKKQFLTYGAEPGFDDASDPAIMLEEALIDGYPKEKEKITALFNSIRFGSYSRGAETQIGGVIAKVLIRSTNSFLIKGDYCGVKYGRTVLVNNDLVKVLVGRRYIVNGTIETLETEDDVKKNIDKKLEIMSPMYCKAEGDAFCKTCIGKKAENYKNFIPVMAADLGGMLLNQKMKAMHGKELSTIKLDMIELIS